MHSLGAHSSPSVKSTSATSHHLLPSVTSHVMGDSGSWKPVVPRVARSAPLQKTFTLGVMPAGGKAENMKTPTRIHSFVGGKSMLMFSGAQKLMSLGSVAVRLQLTLSRSSRGLWQP